MFPNSMAALARPFFAGCLLAAAAVAPATAAEKDDVVATVDGVEITETDLALAAQDYAQDIAQVPEALRRNLLIGVLVDMHVLANAALEAGRAEEEMVKQQLEYVRLRTLRDSYFGDGAELQPSEEDLKALYDEKYGDFEGAEERSARHILVKTKEEAEAIIEELEGGKDFAELAKEKSTGPSGPGGGDLGYFTKDRMVAPFAEAAFSMESGSVSKEPVETQFGWHVIKVEDVRQQPAPAFEQVKAQLSNDFIRAKYNEVIGELKAKAEIEVVGGDAEAAEGAADDAASGDEDKPAEQ